MLGGLLRRAGLTGQQHSTAASPTVARTSNSFFSGRIITPIAKLLRIPDCGGSSRQRNVEQSQQLYVAKWQHAVGKLDRKARF